MSPKNPLKRTKPEEHAVAFGLSWTKIQKKERKLGIRVFFLASHQQQSSHYNDNNHNHARATGKPERFIVTRSFLAQWGQ
jgi:hypothetical protein